MKTRLKQIKNAEKLNLNTSKILESYNKIAIKLNEKYNP